MNSQFDEKTVEDAERNAVRARNAQRKRHSAENQRFYDRLDFRTHKIWDWNHTTEPPHPECLRTLVGTEGVHAFVIPAQSTLAAHTSVRETESCT